MRTCVVVFFFLGTKNITARLPQPVSGVEDLFISVSLDKPLLSEEHKRELNPMIITIKSVNDLPDSPLNFEQLRQKLVTISSSSPFIILTISSSSSFHHCPHNYSSSSPFQFVVTISSP
jgi:hypothetical protein